MTKGDGPFSVSSGSAGLQVIFQFFQSGISPQNTQNTQKYGQNESTF